MKNKTKIITSFLMAAIAVAVIGNIFLNKNKTPHYLTGTFIQYQSWMDPLTDQQWVQELDTIRDSGMNEIFVQWLEFDGTQFSSKLTERLLEYADQNNMRIYLGVRFHSDWWKSWDNTTFLDATVQQDAKVAQDAWKKYGHHKSLVGWYIPYELSDGSFSDVQTDQLNHFFGRLTAELKKASSEKMLITISTFFTGNLSPKQTRQLFTKVFANTGIDVYLVQDGVGTHNWEGQVDDKVVPYLEAFEKVASKNNAAVWPVVEVFTTVKQEGKADERVPTTITRLDEQLINLSSMSVNKAIAFDFFHYMSPVRGAKQAELHQAYLQRLKTQVKHL
jgi:hypothetical protein